MLKVIYDLVENNQETLLSWKPVAVGVGLYITTILGLKFYMRSRQPFDLRTGLKYHNLILFIMSVVMLVGGIYELFVSFSSLPFEDVFCSTTLRQGSYKLSQGGLFWSYVFYLSKYYEFVDTLFIVLRKKELIFLHFYHHIVVVPLSLAFITQGMYFYMNGVFANALIHSFMYWSYYKTSIGQPPTWKKYLTKGQMVQFIWGLATTMAWPITCGYSFTDVSGPMFVFWFNQIVLLSFFMLFKMFYSRRYPEKRAKGKKTE